MSQKVGEQIQDLGRGLQHWVRSTGVAVRSGIAAALPAWVVGRTKHLSSERLTTRCTRNLHMPIALSVLLVLAGYYAGSIVGIQLGLLPWGIGAIWPPTAILLAALFLAPPRHWWMYLLGVVPTHLHVVASFQVPEVPLVVMLCQVGSNILLALLAAFALRSLIGAPPRLTNLRNMGAFILLAGVVATAVACAVAVWLFLLNGWATDFWLVWRQRVLANVFSIITIPPVIVQAFAGQLVGAHATWRSYLELALITMGVLVVGIPIFGLDSPGPSNLPGLLLAPLPFLIWAAVRVGVGGTGLTLLIVAGIALANTYAGRGPFINQAPGTNVLSLQIFLTAISIPILLLAALVEERQQEAESLEQTSKMAELALAERSLQLALAGKAALVGSFAFDANTDKIQISAGYAAIHGFPDGTTEIKRSEWQAGVHCEDLVRVEEIRSLAYRRQLSEYSAEYRIVRSAGEVRWIESRYFVSYRSDGRPLRVIGVNIDVTERKKAERALAERDALIGLAEKVIRVGTYAVDIDTGRVHLSAGCVAIHGFPEGTAEIQREDWRAGVHPDDLARIDRLLSRAFAERWPEYKVDYRIIRSSGEVRWIEARATISYDRNGRPQRFIGVNIDVTERKRAEEHQSLLIAELDHRVKNVLATVSAVTSFTQNASSSAADFVAALDGRIKSMAATHQLLSSHQWKGILLSDLVRRELAPYAANGNTEIAGPEIMLNAEAAQAVSMVLHELATNAAKHGALSTRDGRVCVRWHRVLNGDADAPLRMEWQESGGPPVQAPDRSGYGMEVIRDLLPYELNGEVDLAFASEGVQCRFDIPLSELTSGDWG